MYLIDLLRVVSETTNVYIVDGRGHVLARNAMKNKIDKKYYNYVVDSVASWIIDEGDCILRIKIVEDY